MVMALLYLLSAAVGYRV